MHLVGPPASGKRTVGLELARLTGAVLLDNHLFNDAVFRPYGADGLRPIPTEIHALASQVRALGLEAARRAPPDVSHIFTSYLTTKPSGPAALQLVRDLAGARAARYVPVWLTCDPAVLEERLEHPGRLERAKLRDPLILRQTLATSGVLAPPPDALVIDTTQLAAGETAARIAATLAQ
ncbi:MULTISPECIES: AAA family ATPase [Deinococcus]|uniref:Shikimate kinase n=1 Tax=Deinococcus rufus TaxID=2136097 RepID=A0ABV7ZG59_9DEIO|nr:hypothetical protein [Deinococcus sp. AB2017081]WQE93679.1 hypothetical protein U2P90_09675 [Deinococcus sp. AB2017081]